MWQLHHPHEAEAVAQAQGEQGLEPAARVCVGKGKRGVEATLSAVCDAGCWQCKNRTRRTRTCSDWMHANMAGVGVGVSQ